MDQLIPIFLPVYFLVYFSIAFVLKSWIVAKRIGKNPFVIPRDESAYGLIGFYFKVTLVGMFLYTIFYAIFPTKEEFYLPIRQLEIVAIRYTGIGILFFALAWTIIAQAQMKDSWRIGIDHDTASELVTTGLFSISRNPIFFGMTLSLLGLFLVTPNALTLVFLLMGHVLMQIQIRLEEEFLTKEHGQLYSDYTKKVRRMI